MNREQIAQRIAGLTDEQRDELYRLCADRRRINRHGAAEAVYETVREDMAEALHRQELVWLIDSTLAAVRHDVYDYWAKHIGTPALQPAG